VYNGRPMRTRILITALFGCVLAACGGDDGGGSGGPDAPPAIDAAPDAPAIKQIGAPCTPSQTDPAGDCGAGFLCVGLQGGSGNFCTKTCTQGSGDTCAQGYIGQGKPACIISAMPAGGGQSITVCGIICSATNPQLCSTCDGTCPSPLQCNVPLMDTGGNTVGQACK